MSDIGQYGCIGEKKIIGVRPFGMVYPEFIEGLRTSFR
jgi:hypothetical protein